MLVRQDHMTRNISHPDAQEKNMTEGLMLSITPMQGGAESTDMQQCSMCPEE
jgi:hypothetical protein